MLCQTETVQAREAREQEKDGAPEGARVLAEDRVPERDEEWEGRWAAVDQSRVLQDTVCVRTAD